MKRRILIISALVFLLIRIIFLLVLYKDHFVYSYWKNFEKLKDDYLHSQYVVSNPKGWIPDEMVYSYAAGAYIRGESVLDVNPGTPPLGKHIFSLSILLFDNPNVVLIAFFIFFIIGFIFLARSVTGSLLISLICANAILFQPLITDQLRYMPLLDLPLITFHVWSFYFMTRAIQTTKSIFLLTSFIMLGLSVMTKIFTISIPILLIFTMYILLKKRTLIVPVIIGYGLIFLITVLSYTQIYFQGYTPLKIYGILKWSYLYNASKLNNFFTVWDLVFFNKWHVWWGDKAIIKDANWHASWPLLFGVSILWLGYQTRMLFNIKVEKLFVYIWMVIYFVMLSLNQTTARYLIPIIPFTYIVFGDLIGIFYRKYGKIYTSLCLKNHGFLSCLIHK